MKEAEINEVKRFVHEMANEMAIIEGYLRFSIDKGQVEDKKYLEKAYAKVESSIERIHKFRSTLE